MQKQLLQLRKFAVFCTWLGVGLFITGAIAESHLKKLPLWEPQWRGVLAAGFFLLVIMNWIFLYRPRGSSHRIGRGAFQLFIFSDLVFVIILASGNNRFSREFASFHCLGQFGFCLLYCSNFAICKYRQMLDELVPATCRNLTGQLLRRLRPWQIAMWVLLVLRLPFLESLLDIDAETIILSFWLAFVLGGIGIAIYLAFKIRRDWRCPACRTRLPLLRTAWLLLPKRLSQEWQRCPHCGFDFDRELPEAEGAIPAAAPVA